MNNVSLIGRITADPDVKNSSNGKPLCHFTLAVDRAFKREGQPDADFIRCIAFDKTADIMSRYVHKGDRLGVSGSIQTGSYTDKDGKKVYTTDVLVQRMDLLEPKRQQATNYQPQTYQQPARQQAAGDQQDQHDPASSNRPPKTFAYNDSDYVDDSDLPF